VYNIFRMKHEAKSFLVVAKTSTDCKILKYNLTQLLDTLETDPLEIEQSEPIRG
jgi:Cdc6-like AAA superfamily ATPase